MKKLVLLSFLLALVLPLNAYSYSGPSYDSGTTYNTTALTGFSTNGDMMDGMQVTAYTSGGTQVLTWATTGSGSGGVTGTGWSLLQSGDTFSTDSWTLWAQAGTTISRLVIDARPGSTVFDTITDPVTSPGSARGAAFAPQSVPSSLLSATYRDLLGVGGTVYGDLYLQLDLQFVGFTDATMKFTADTDNASIKGDIVPSPEPLTLLLLGLGLTGIAGLRRRDK
jgi:hypothetical protein